MPGKMVVVVGAGPIGAILAGMLANGKQKIALVDVLRDRLDAMKKNGIEISGVVERKSRIGDVRYSIADAADLKPDFVFVAVKACALGIVVPELKKVFSGKAKIVSFQNGLDNEEVISEAFGAGATLRVVINYAGNMLSDSEVKMTFFNKPNYVGALGKAGKKAAKDIAEMMTAAGLDTKYADDIKRYEWEKVILNAALMPISAITRMTMKQVMDFPPTKRLVEETLRECIAVAKAAGHDYGDGFYDHGIGYLLKAGHHKPSMVGDIEAKRPTEIDFLNGKIAQHGERLCVPVPYNTSLTNLVKGIEEVNRTTK
jgi:2-dehydropantoate 2-reductase